MHFSTLCSVAAAITAITAFTIPAGQPNGVYSVTLDSEGNEIHTLLSNITTKRDFAIRGASFDHEKRQVQTGNAVVCKGFEGQLSPTDNGNAATNLANQCGSAALVGARLNYYAIVGCSVAYFCNLKYVSQICTSGNAWNSFNTINNVCSPNTPGYQIYTDTNGQDQYGYENYCTQSGAHFCR